MRHVIPISGKDSLATALVQTTRYPDLPYEFLFTDVGAELPETYAWLDKVEESTGWRIERVGKSLREGIRSYGGFLPSARARYCTKECKIEPMEEWLGKEPATVYYGLRADEVRTGYVPTTRHDVTPSYPLRDAGIDLQGVYAILDAQRLTPPDFFWPRLYEVVAGLMSGWDGWQEKIGRTERAILFAGRSRGNCSFCFFQRLYEVIWLRETHPSLFEDMRSLEKPGYSFIRDFPLDELTDARAEQVFMDRAKVVSSVIKRRYQGLLFGEPVDNEIALTSCGLLCGK